MHKYIVLSFFILVSFILGEDQKPFKHEKRIISALNSYVSSVDQKDLGGMLQHVTIPLDLHFGSQKVTTIRSENDFKEIFKDWKNSDRSNFHSTKIRSIQIEQTGIIKNMLAVADVTYDRLSDSGDVIRTERALYHFVKGNGYYAKPLQFIWALSTKWARGWKIYMISNVDIAQ